MGCGSSRATEESDKKNQTQDQNKKSEVQISVNKNTTLAGGKEDNQELIEKVFNGIIADGTPFNDCLITSQEEFNRKLKSCIAEQLTELVENHPGARPNVKFVPNDKDEILNNPNLKIDFSKFHVIAIKGAQIESVKLKNGVYSITVIEGKFVGDNEYCAVQVYIPDGEVPTGWEFVNPPNKSLGIQQRPLNHNSIPFN